MTLNTIITIYPNPGFQNEVYLIITLILPELIVPNILSWQMNATIYCVSQKGTILHQALLITIFLLTLYIKINDDL